jgi:hypothetical protein
MKALKASLLIILISSSIYCDLIFTFAFSDNNNSILKLTVGSSGFKIYYTSSKVETCKPTEINTKANRYSIYCLNSIVKIIEDKSVLLFYALKQDDFLYEDSVKASKFLQTFNNWRKTNKEYVKEVLTIFDDVGGHVISDEDIIALKEGIIK